jgi:glutamate 5-kinase
MVVGGDCAPNALSRGICNAGAPVGRVAPLPPQPPRPMNAAVPTLADFRRIVVKVGSSLLVDSAAGRVRASWLASLAADLAALHAERRDILIVSSGAIALGRGILRLPAGSLRLEDSQAAAAVGQIALARTWAEVLERHGITAGQVLVTLGDTEERRRYLNARSTIAKLMEWRAIPVINENDTVATTEIRYGDNDRLAARVATMASADLLVLLSDIDGLYDAPPGENPQAKLIPLVPRITAEIEAMAGDAGSELSRGGMRTKIEAGKIATTAGSHMVIASGHPEHPLKAIAAGGPCTWFLTPANPVTARKKWIAGSLEPRGTLVIDAGAIAALRRGKSLLPAGVIRVDGAFSRGDAVLIRGPDGAEIGRGLSAYDAEDAAKIRGKSSGDIQLILGFAGRAAMVHRDDLVLGRA